MEIAVLGGGVEGRAMIAYLRRHGESDITLCDHNANYGPFPEGVVLRLGPECLKNLVEFDVVYRSPGVPTLLPKLTEARQRGVRVSTPTQYFFEHCPARIVGVTGTKGKGTTATLIAEILKRAGHSVFLGGNIGRPPIEFLDELTPYDLVALELSSFQLQDLTISPHVAVILRTTQDHLDYHRDREEYFEAKMQIARYQKEGNWLIAHASVSGLPQTKARQVSVSSEHVPDNSFAAYVEGETLMWRDEGKAQPVCKRNEIALIGPHNVENVLAAIAASGALGAPREAMAAAIAAFKGLPHRLECVAEKNGVTFYNDSFSTTPETCIAAIRSFEKPVILIAGGSEKGADFTEWGRAIRDRLNVKAVVLMGMIRQKMEHALDGAAEERRKKIEAERHAGKTVQETLVPLTVVQAERFPEAFMTASLMAKPGDIVLLSPAAASFDQFENYKARGEAFRESVDPWSSQG